MSQSPLRLIKRGAEFIPKERINDLPRGLRGIYVLYKHKAYKHKAYKRESEATKIQRPLYRHGKSWTAGWFPWQVAESCPKREKRSPVDTLLSFRSLGKYPR